MRTLNEDYPLLPVPQISSLQDMVRGSASRHPGKLALEDLNETPIPRVTYQELKEKVVAFGQALRRIGLEERDHLTETSPIVALNRLRKFRDDAAGLLLPGLEVRIVDPDEEGRGEIVVRGPSVMLGYYRNEEATNQVLKDGWFATGDYGYFDADRFLHISGRKKNVIVASNGKNVFPEELEDQVNAIPFVLESAVYGVKGPNGDEEICVMVVPNAETLLAHADKTGDQLTREWIEDVINQEIRALNRRLPLYKQIRRVRIKDSEFEKTTSMKIKRYLLHQEDTTH
ncbi:MAG: AMP-binding protein [Thermoanaerobaculaceae bacterium]|nr:AMP-binding protein [Thermoanaerobaculaceae bacterium]